MAVAARKQLESKAAWNESRPAELAHFFTLGYSGRKAGQIVELLKRHGVRTLLDIRKDPVSPHRPDVNKRTFGALLAENGIGYVHAPELGVPREIRSQSLDREAIWDWYEATVLAPHAGLRAYIESFDQPVALMCTEIDPHECHRHCVALALERTGLKSFDL